MKGNRISFTRRPGERIVIGGNVSIEVKRASGGSVELVIRAPAEVTVDRGEVHDAKMTLVLASLVKGGAA